MGYDTKIGFYIFNKIEKQMLEKIITNCWAIDLFLLMPKCKENLGHICEY